MKFLCDEMLVRLGRWLRAAGYDTRIADSGSDDGRLLDTAIAEDRILLTRDRELVKRRDAGDRVVVLEAADLEGMAGEVGRRLEIDWLAAPFTRCVVDNAVLGEPREAELTVVPPRARAMGGPFTVCPDCRRVYWSGSHRRRMRERLNRWRNLSG